MDSREDNRPGLEEIRIWIHALRHEIEDLRKADQQQRLSRRSQVSWDSQKQHEARVARMDEIKEELIKLGRGMKAERRNQTLQAILFPHALAVLDKRRRVPRRYSITTLRAQPGSIALTLSSIFPSFVRTPPSSLPSHSPLPICW
jgi:hypothetical protein